MEPIWINRYDKGVPGSLDYPDWTLPDLLHRSARRFPHSSAVWFYGRRITFVELEELTTKFALVLQSLGVSPGDRVTLMLPNLPQTLICYYGALKAGAVVVQTNPLYVTSEIEQQLLDTGSETMVALDLFYPRIHSTLDHTPVETNYSHRCQRFSFSPTTTDLPDSSQNSWPLDPRAATLTDP